MQSQVLMPGSCGELVQGILSDVNFHITCPINRFSRASAELLKNGPLSVPEGLSKTKAAVERVLEEVKSDQSVSINIKSDIPAGKGMASSTADIVSVALAVSELFEKRAEAQEMAELALSIEPTDGTLFKGIVAFDHIGGGFFEAIGEAPPIDIVVLEPPETLDTVIFNEAKNKYIKSGLAYDDRICKEAFEMAVEGIRSKNLKLIGEAATLSATLNQKLLLKPELNDIITTCRRRGGIGVNIAHSGTVIGMIAERGYAERLLDKIKHYVPRYWSTYVVKVIDGGPRFCGPDDLASMLTVETSRIS